MMHITIHHHHYHHADQECTDKLDRLLEQVEGLIMTVAESIAKLQGEVAQQTTIIGSVQTLLTSLAQQISDLKNAGNSDPAVQAAIDALAASVDANNLVLANAVTTNTQPPVVVPPAPAPEPDPVVPPTA